MGAGGSGDEDVSEVNSFRLEFYKALHTICSFFLMAE